MQLGEHQIVVLAMLCPTMLNSKIYNKNIQFQICSQRESIQIFLQRKAGN